MRTVNLGDITAMLDATMRTLAERHPECTSGDLDAASLDELLRALRTAANAWLNWNTPEDRI